jgi:GH15 family glucan-1,4-alpha-glucosidase
MSELPIADYALLSDCRSAALVSRGGSIDWLCFPRFDGPSVFGRILDDAAGHWSIRPAAGTSFETSRRYVDNTLVLETTFTTTGGSVSLTDALAVGRNERGHALGAGAAGTVLRRLVGITGVVDMELVYAPRPEYALGAPALQATDGGVTARCGDDELALSSPVPLATDGFTASARFALSAGEIAVTESRLRDARGLVYRYRAADGLDGEEGTFLLCTFWLAQAQARAGALDAARSTFTAAAAFVNDVGLMSEEVDAETGELLGNFPQAFSHIGLVNAAWAIAEAERRERGRPHGGRAHVEL